MQVEDQPKLQTLAAEVKRLKEALVQTQLKLLKAESYLSVACEAFGQSVEELEKKGVGKEFKSP